MIATDHPLSSEAGLSVYKKGGNVVDAFVAASFAICVLRPQSTGLLGGGFALTLDSKGTEAFDFRERASAKAMASIYLDKNGIPIPGKTSKGAYSAGIPGMVPGLFLIHKKKGKLRWKELITPAILLAKEGFPVYKDLEDKIGSHYAQWSKVEKKQFSIGDRPIRSGEILVQTDLASVLERIADLGEEDFRKGETAKQIVQFYSDYADFIDAKDLTQYKVKVVKPIQTRSFGKTIYSMPPPSSAVFLFSTLLTFDELKIKSSNENRFNARKNYYFAESMRLAYKDRAEWGGDPEFTDVPVQDFLSKEKAGLKANEIIRNELAFLEPTHSSVKPWESTPIPNPYMKKESFNTTHISVLDSKGNAVSSTHSVNGLFGSGVIVPNTGMFLNNTMDDFSVSLNIPNIYGLVGSKANFIAPNKTPLSSMSPLIVVDPKLNKPELVIGAPGGSQIPSSILNSIVDFYEGSRDLYMAVSRPRIHHQFMPDILFLENEWKDKLPMDLNSYKIQYGKHRAKVFAVAKEGNTLIGVSDPRGDGSPAGF